MEACRVWLRFALLGNVVEGEEIDFRVARALVEASPRSRHTADQSSAAGELSYWVAVRAHQFWVTVDV